MFLPFRVLYWAKFLVIFNLPKLSRKKDYFIQKKPPLNGRIIKPYFFRTYPQLASVAAIK